MPGRIGRGTWAARACGGQRQTTQVRQECGSQVRDVIGQRVQAAEGIVESEREIHHRPGLQPHGTLGTGEKHVPKGPQMADRGVVDDVVLIIENEGASQAVCIGGPAPPRGRSEIAKNHGMGSRTLAAIRPSGAQIFLLDLRASLLNGSFLLFRLIQSFSHGNWPAAPVFSGPDVSLLLTGRVPQGTRNILSACCRANKNPSSDSKGSRRTRVETGKPIYPMHNGRRREYNRGIPKHCGHYGARAMTYHRFPTRRKDPRRPRD